MVREIVQRAMIVIAATVLGLGGVAQAKDEDLKVKGILEAKAATAVTIGGIDYQVTAATEYENAFDQKIAFADLTIGVLVKVEYMPLANGSLRAKEIEIEGSDGSSGDDRRGDDRSDRGDDDSATDSTRNGKKMSRIRITLVAEGGSLVKAKAEHETKKNEREFKATLKLPATSPLAPSDNAAARSLDVEATLSRDGAPYAICALQFKPKADPAYGFEWKAEQELKSKRVKKNRNPIERFRSKAGMCDTDTAQVGTQPGVPNVQRGDAISITVNDVRVAAGEAK
jgi:hypothetical protein